MFRCHFVFRSIIFDSSLLKFMNNKKGREVFYRINDKKFIALIRDLNRNPVFKELILKALED